jgi:heterodisulfide reductase subunit A
VGEKIGVYICHCGSNIAGVVDVAEVARWAKEKFPEVAISRDYKFMCSSPGQELIEKDIKELGLTRVVVAACSPRRLPKSRFESIPFRNGVHTRTSGLGYNG